MPLIVFEGAEGAGKSTQVRILAEWLGAAGRTVVATREPGGTPLGDAIRALLLDPAGHVSTRAETLLFMASRAQLVEQSIRPALAGGATVILDRFFLSTYAYQVAGRGLSEDQIREANRLATGDLRPDLTLLLSLPLDVGLTRAAKRGPADRMERADRDFHARVAAAFTEFASEEWQRSHAEAGPIVVVDASGSVEEVFERVMAAANHRWPGSFQLTRPMEGRARR
jgi:dTMP kinase